MIEGNVKAVLSEGDEECFVCEQRMVPRRGAIEVRFRVDLLVTSKEVSKHAHIGCAQNLSELIARRATEARQMERFA